MIASIRRNWTYNSTNSTLGTCSASKKGLL